MATQKLIRLVIQNILRNKKNFIFSCVGITIGVAMFSFFVALAFGIQERVLNRMYPMTQLELEPRSFDLLGVQGRVNTVALTDERVDLLRQMDGVKGAYPKQRTKFQARLWGGAELFGKALHAEAFFDGLGPDLVLEELRRDEGTLKRHFRNSANYGGPCKDGRNCGPGLVCDHGTCRISEFAVQFKDWGEYTQCVTSDGCPHGYACLQGQCRLNPCERSDGSGCGTGDVCVSVSCESGVDCGGGSCLSGYCKQGFCSSECRMTAGPQFNAADCPLDHMCSGLQCETGADCGGDQECVNGQCAGRGYCERISCRLVEQGHQESEDPSNYRGAVAGYCEGGLPPAEGTKCVRPMRCPVDTYCAGMNWNTALGHCEHPIPVILSPFLLEIFHTAVTAAWDVKGFKQKHEAFGLEFFVQYGDSFLSTDLPDEVQAIKRARVVGFSDKALDLGFTTPLAYVERANARYRGSRAAAEYDSVIVEAFSNEEVHGLMEAGEEMGFELSAKSKDAKKAGVMLYILTLVFSMISWAILAVAALNICHNFMMVVAQRRRELGILRSLGATKSDLRRLVLVESALIGVVGAAIGNAIALAGSHGVNRLAAEQLQSLPFRPDDFFHFYPSYQMGSVLLAVVFCVAGAFPPANRAANLDPAIVTSQA